MSRQIAFTVNGTPRPQPRPRFVRGRAVSIADRKTKLWSDAVLRAASAAFAHSGSEPFSGAVAMEVVFRFEASREEQIGQAHTIKPDASNLLKLAEDRLQDARLFGDDCQIASVKASKVWAARAGMGVSIRALNGAKSCRKPGQDARQAISGVLDTPAWLTRLPEP